MKKNIGFLIVHLTFKIMSLAMSPLFSIRVKLITRKTHLIRCQKHDQSKIKKIC